MPEATSRSSSFRYVSVVSLFLCLALVALAKDTTHDLDRIKKDYGKLPLSFEANQGQSDVRVKFLSREANSTIFLTADGAVVSVVDRKAAKSARTGRSLPPSVVKNSVFRLKLLGSNRNAAVSGDDLLSGKTNYLIGNDPKKWQTDVPSYSHVKYSDVYPGVDLVFYGNRSGQLEHDFIVRPGGEPKDITLRLEGARGISIGSSGDLRGYVGDRPFELQKPVIYQELDGVRREVAGRYRLTSRNRVSFVVSEYDHTKPVVIDPVLVYGTYVGGGLNESGAIAIDLAGNAYIGGSTASSNYPTTAGAFLATCPGTNCSAAFVTKVSADGSSLLYSTFLGGSSQNFAYSIAVDAGGHAYITGHTNSIDFPATSNAYQTECGATSPGPPPFCIGTSAFLTELDTTGSSLVYSTLLSGSDGTTTIGASVAVDTAGKIYVTGSTTSVSFPTVNAFQSAYGGSTDAFVAKFDPTLSGLDSLVYSTYLGGSSQDLQDEGELGSGNIAVDSTGNAYVTGMTNSTDFPVTLTTAFQPGCGTDGTCNGNAGNPDGFDSFLTKIDTTQSGSASLIYSTYLGGSNQERGEGIALDPANSVYITGITESVDFPTTAGAYQTSCLSPSESTIDSFIAKFDTTLSGTASLVYSTCLGGNVLSSGIAVDGSGNAYLSGDINSLFLSFPQENAIETGSGNDLVLKLAPDGSALIWATRLGGTGTEQPHSSIALDPSSNVYVFGNTTSFLDFPTTAGAFQQACVASEGCNSDNIANFLVKISQGDGAMSSLGPWALAFASQTQGSSSPVQTVTVRDMGDQPFNIIGISFGGTNPGDFSETDNCGTPSFPFTLGAASQCIISVTFTPQGTGPRSATLSIADTASGSPHVASLSGAGTSGTPPLEFLPATISFGNQALGTTSTSHTLTIKNTSTAPVTQIAVGVTGANPGDFALTTSCGSTLAAGASCKSTIKFTPSVLAAETATVSVTDSSFSIAQTASLSGKGVVPAALTPSTLAFGSVGLDSPSASKIATLTNNNSFLVDISNIAISGTNSADFTQSATTCGASLAAKGHCTITLVFTPSVAGAETASLVTTDAATDSPQTISLTGTGVAPITVTPASLVFANQNAGTTSAAKTITIKNDQNTPLTDFGPSISGTYAASFSYTTTCTSVLAAGKTCTVSLKFLPGGTGPQNAIMTIYSASTSPQQVPLSGTGVISVTVTPATLTFASQTVGTTSASKTITVKNNNTTEPLPYISISLTGSDTGDFNPTNNCTSSLAPSSSCTITVTFDPTATGSRTATLIISDINGTTDQQIVSLSGTGK
jgi:hypothetical protein